MLDTGTDVIVVGGGNAGMCAALAAAEAGARVTILERATKAEAGGNTAYTAGAMRVVYHGVDDLLSLCEISDEQLANTDFGTYTEADFLGDIARVTEYRCDPDLAQLLVENSLDTLQWMRSKGVRFAPIYGRQAFKVDGKFKFWGGLTIEVVGGGPGLVEAETEAATRAGVEILYRTRAIGLLRDDAGVHGVRVRQDGVTKDLTATSVVLAAGGFQSNAEWRTKYLGPGWDLAKVRGTRLNTGDGIKMALEAGASPAGHWSGCHAVGWDRNAPEFGDLRVGDGFQKHSYPFGIMINADGERFLDEGADYRNYTYAKYGRRILEQPNQLAYQIFDDQVTHLLRDEYRIREATKVSANSLEELAAKLEGVDQDAFLETVRAYNEAVDTDVPFDPNNKDGRRTVGLEVDKTNWANRIDTPPYQAFATTCGITFTFGGLRINERGEVIDEDGESIPGLYACGELVGGLFYFNYPGGSGLTAGSVYGRIAGTSASETKATTASATPSAVV